MIGSSKQRAGESSCDPSLHTCRPNPSSATQNKKIDSIEGIVQDYIQQHRSCLRKLLESYANLPSETKALQAAALAKVPNRKEHPQRWRRHRHQWRIPGPVLTQARENLDISHFRKCRNLDDVHKTMRQHIGQIAGIGDLAVYDAALRFAAWRKRYPDKVYLHAGTRLGALALGLGRGREYLEVEDLPRAFRKLKAYEIEDCLCIYKDDLRRLQRLKLRAQKRRTAAEN